MAPIRRNLNRQRCFDLSAGHSLNMVCVINDYMGLDRSAVSCVQSHSFISADPGKHMPVSTCRSKQGTALGFVQSMGSQAIPDQCFKSGNFLAGMYGWGGAGRRRCQRRRTCCWGCRHASTCCVQGSLRYSIGNAVGFVNDFKAVSSSSGLKKGPIRWSTEEVRLLVQGASLYGMRKWGKVKKEFFAGSNRTRVQLKDKWRDISRACGIDVGTKNKVEPHKSTLELLAGLEEEIRSIHANNAAMNREET